jgi:hypothetical protein
MQKPSCRPSFGIFSWLESLIFIERTINQLFDRTPWLKERKTKNLWLALLLVAFLGPWGLLYASWLTSLVFVGVYYISAFLLPWPKFVKVVLWWGWPAFTAFGVVFVQKLKDANQNSVGSDEFNSDESIAGAGTSAEFAPHSGDQSAEKAPANREPPETKVIMGKTYVKINGEWFEG